MAKPTILKERGTGEELYPQTLASLVHTSSGENVDDVLSSKQDALTTSEDLSISASNKLSLTDMAKKRLFIDMFNEAAGTYGYARIVDGVFDCKLNDISLTYQEAIDIYKSSANIGYLGFGDSHLTYYPYKTTFPIKVLPFGVGFVNPLFCALSEIEILVMDLTHAIPYINLLEAFTNCTKLREIRGFFSAKGEKYRKAFENCVNLIEVRLNRIAYDISFSDSAQLSLASIKNIVRNAANGTSTITVTVHADVYAKLTGDTTNEAAAALAPEELAQWQQVLTDAAAKNINFATA